MLLKELENRDRQARPFPKARRLLLRLWMVAVCVVVVGSLLPGPTLHRIHFDDLGLNDKLLHFLNYTILACLPVVALGWSTPEFSVRPV